MFDTFTDNPVKVISNGECDTLLDDIILAAKSRKLLLGQEDADFTDELQPGDIIRFSDTIRPRYLIGLTATVVKKNPKTIVVSCPDESAYGRFRNSKNIRCPKSLIAGKV